MENDITVPDSIPQDTLTVFRNTMTYGHERAYVTEGNVFNAKMREAFFSKVYFDRPLYEEKLLSFCRSEGAGLGIVMGVQGSGKSTIVQRVQSFLDDEEFPFLVIDFISFYTDKLSYAPLGAWRRIVEENLKEQISSRFFDEERIDSFFPYFLYEDKKTRPLFRQDLDKIGRLYRKEQLENEGNLVASEQEWFRTQLPRHIGLADSIDRKLTLEHYFKAARRKAKGAIKQFVVVLDNVDRVERHHQCHIYAVAEDLRATHTTSANIIITTRKDTCHPPEEVCNVHQMPIAEIGIYDAMHNDEGVLTHEHFQEILNRRVAAFRTVAKGLPFAEQLAAISRSLREEYAEIVLINVANQSIRDALRYHCDFVEYLISEYPPDEVYNRLVDRRQVGSFLISCLYGWIATHDNVLNRQCLNLVELVDRCATRKYIGIAGCDLTYLLLVCLLNYHRRRTANPTVRDLFSCFVHLDYPDKDLREALFDLWNLRTHEFGHVLSIYQKNLPKSADDITDSAEVELNYRGETLIDRVSVSFTFINRLLYDKGGSFYPKHHKDKVDRYYEISHLPRHLKQTVHFLFRLAFLHSLELHKIRSRYGTEKWFSDYAHDFCIGRDLQLQRIIDSHCAFLHRAIEYHGRREGNNWRNGLEKGMEQLTFLSRLYDMQVKQFGPGNMDDKHVVDYEKIHEEMTAGRLDMEDAPKAFAEYRKDITPML